MEKHRRQSVALKKDLKNSFQANFPSLIFIAVFKYYFFQSKMWLVAPQSKTKVGNQNSIVLLVLSDAMSFHMSCHLSRHMSCHI